MACSLMPMRACTRRSGPGAPPAALAESPHRGRHEHAADERRVDQDREPAAESEELDEAHLAGAEGEEADREQRGGRRDDAAGAGQAVGDRAGVLAPLSCSSLMRLIRKTS